MMIIIRKMKINALLTLVGVVFVLIPITSLRLINNLGYIKLAQGLKLNSSQSMERAESLFRSSINLWNENTSAYRGLGITLSAQGNLEEAQQIWSMISFDPSALYLGWGDVAKINRESENALYWYQKAVDVDSENAKSWHQMGALQREMGSVDEAIESYQKAFSLGWAESAQPYGMLMFNLKEYSDAENIWLEALYRFPFDNQRIFWWRNIVYVHLTEENWSRALGVLESALSEYPEDAVLFQQKGIAIYNQTGNAGEALAYLDQAISLDGEYASIYKGKGDVLSQEEKFQDALVWYAKAIEIDPGNPSWYLAYARTADLAGDKALALEIYQDVTAHFPDHVYAHYELANCYYQTAVYEKAADAIEITLKASKKPSASHFLLAAKIYEAVGDFDEAVDYYLQVLTLQPDNQTAADSLDRLQDR